MLTRSIDPNDPTKATFKVLKEFTDTFTIPQTNEERKEQEENIKKIENNLRAYNFNFYYSGEMRELFIDRKENPVILLDEIGKHIEWMSKLQS